MPARARAILSGAALERAVAARRAAGGPPPDAAVVIDVLRATTTLVHAFARGAASAHAFATPDEASRAAARLPAGTTLLCGERGGLRIPGFDLGNSPREYVDEFVRGRALHVTTTNGTRALTRTREARRQMLAAFVNLDAVARRLRALAAAAPAGADYEAWIVAAGKEEAPSDEDTACAVALLDALAAGEPAFAGAIEEGEAIPPAALAAARAPDDAAREAFLAATEHGRALLAVDAAFARDIADAARLDAFALVPEGRAGTIDMVARPA